MTATFSVLERIASLFKLIAALFKPMAFGLFYFVITIFNRKIIGYE